MDEKRICLIARLLTDFTNPSPSFAIHPLLKARPWPTFAASSPTNFLSSCGLTGAPDPLIGNAAHTLASCDPSKRTWAPSGINTWEIVSCDLYVIISRLDSELRAPRITSWSSCEAASVVLPGRMSVLVSDIVERFSRVSRMYFCRISAMDDLSWNGLPRMISTALSFLSSRSPAVWLLHSGTTLGRELNHLWVWFERILMRDHRTHALYASVNLTRSCWTKNWCNYFKTRYQRP